MKIEVYRGRHWEQKEVTGRQVGRYWVEDDNTMYSPAHWRPAGSSKGFWLKAEKRVRKTAPSIKPKSYYAGPFTRDEMGMAQKIANDSGKQIQRWGTRWWVV